MEFIRKDIDDKSILWFEPSNQYLIFEPKTADIIENLLQGNTLESVGNQVAKDLDVPYEKAIDFVIDIDENVIRQQIAPEATDLKNYSQQNFDKDYEFVHYYTLNSKHICIAYQSLYELELVHPKFAHLATDKKGEPALSLQIFTDFGHTFLLKNGLYFNDWSRKDIHYLQGKVSMLLVQEMFENKEEDWMGVFHASALSNEKKSILFLGDSGHGKSTSLALLQGHGYNCVADDFVPVHREKKVYPFPSAISVKHTSWDFLSEFYPNLNKAKDYHYSSHNKTVKYLPPLNQDFEHIFECKELVFIRYFQDIETLFFPMTHLEAFERLLPDSWISPIQSNVQAFLDWFAELRCYSLTYSNNSEMFEVVDQLFDNDL